MSKQADDKQYTVHNVYVKDISFESPKSPEVFTRDWAPQVDFELNCNSDSVEKEIHEVILKIAVSVRLPKKGTKIAANEEVKEADLETALLAEVQQAGLFFIKGLSDEEQEIVLSIRAPEILFPYAREVISSLASRGGFPQLVMPPVNFEAMYLENKQAKKQPEPSLAD